MSLASQPTDHPLAEAVDSYWNPKLSRRGFLKGAGAAVLVTTLAHELAAPAAAAGAPWAAADAPTLQGQIAASQSPLIQQLVAEFGQRGFAFDINQSSVIASPDHPDLIGLVMRDTRIGSYADGADLACTINLKAPQEATVEALIGWSGESGLTVQSTIFQAGGAASRRPATKNWHIARTAAATTACAAKNPSSAIAYRPVATTHGQSGDAIQVDGSPWYYDHAAQTEWREVAIAPGRSELQLRFTHCAEYRNYRHCAEGEGAQWHGETHLMQIPA